MPSPSEEHPTVGRCHWLRDDDGAEILIPMCMGAAVAGPEGYTCDVPLSRIERAEDARRAAEAEIERLLEKAERRADHVAILVRQNGALRRRLRELEQASGPATSKGQRRGGQAGG